MDNVDASPEKIDFLFITLPQIVVVDATKPPEEVAKAVLDRIKQLENIELDIPIDR